MTIENLKSIKLPTIKFKHLVTSLAGVFAAISVQGTAHFFILLHHPWLASWTLGIAVGCALVVLAHLLADIDMRERKAFFGLLTVTLVLVTLSSIIQGIGYAKELGPIGYLLAFVLVSTGEIVLPLSFSWYNEAKRRQSVNDAGSKVEEIAAQTMIDTMANIDTAKAQRQAEKQIERLIVANLESIVTKLMPKNVATSQPEPMPATAPPRQNPEMSDSETLSPLGIGAHVDDMTAKRSDKASDRRAEIMSYVDSQDVATFTKSMADLFGVSTRTIQRDIAQLEADGLVVANGVIVLRDALQVAA